MVMRSRSYFRSQQDRFGEMNAFYDRVVQARLKDRKAGMDYIDSYRHMREHGNAKSILLQIGTGSIRGDECILRPRRSSPPQGPESGNGLHRLVQAHARTW